MGTFLTTSRMNRALAARVRASVKRGNAQGSAVDRRWTVFFRVAMLVGIVGGLISFTVLRKREDDRLEQSRASLLDAVAKRRAELASADMLTLERALTVLLRSGGPYEGDLVTEQVRGADALAAVLSRPMIYVRGPLDAFRSEDALGQAAVQSQQESFAQCLLDPPRARTEKALLERIRDGSRLQDTTAHVHRFYDLLAGIPILKTPWRTRVKLTQKADELARLERELKAARLDETTAAARARLLLFVADEPSGPTGPTELDGERAHEVRVTLFDLEQARPLFRLRRHVDPGSFSDRGRANHATGLDSCTLSFAVREAAERPAGLTETAAH